MKRLPRFVAGLAALAACLQPAAAATTCQAFGVPAYFYRTETAEYDRIIADPLAKARVSLMVIGACNGDRSDTTPCIKTSDPVYGEFISLFSRAQEAGIRAIGYVTTSYGTRPLAEVKAEINLYLQRYKPAGFFLDEVKNSTDATTFAYYANLSAYIRARRGGFVVLNYGVFPRDERAMQISDVVLTSEGTLENYKSNYGTPPLWARKYPASRFWHLVHGAQNLADMRDTLKLARERNAGLVYVTDETAANTWGRLPVYWSAEVYEAFRGC